MVYKRGNNWYYNARKLPTGKRVVKSAGPSKRAAQQLEAESERQFADFKAGLYNPIVEERVRPIGEHVESFFEAMEIGSLNNGRGAPCDEYVETNRNRLANMLNHMGAETLADLTAEKLNGFLLDLTNGGVVSVRSQRKLRPASTKTRNDYGVLAAQFGDWLVRQKRLGESPFADFQRTSTSGREVRKRIKLRIDDIRKLAYASPERAMVYWVAAFTGLRRRELLDLRWGQIHLEEERPYLTTNASVSKNGKAQVLPLIPSLAKKLADEKLTQAKRASKVISPDDLVLPQMPRDSHLLPVLVRSDAEAAGIATTQLDGSRLDFHSLRGSCATILMNDVGVAPEMVRRIMRHSALSITMKHYVGMDEGDLFDAVKDIEIDCSGFVATQSTSTDIAELSQSTREKHG
tara:strand:+ start:7123 stop:8337 length:1215 start_codon:yes stop_codon:yes gene_type:complete